MVTEEDFERIRDELAVIGKESPGAFTRACTKMFLEEVQKDYNEFVNGIEGEFSNEDKLNIVEGIIRKRSAFWEEAVVEERYEEAQRLLGICRQEVERQLSKTERESRRER